MGSLTAIHKSVLLIPQGSHIYKKHKTKEFSSSSQGRYNVHDLRDEDVLIQEKMVTVPPRVLECKQKMDGTELNVEIIRISSPKGFCHSSRKFPMCERDILSLVRDKDVL